MGRDPYDFQICVYENLYCMDIATVLHKPIELTNADLRVRL